jgi:leucyl-tRNA synthetase
MPQWAGSCVLSSLYRPKKRKEPFSKVKKTIGCRLFVLGGATCLSSLMVHRFWQKYFSILGIVSTDEPFLKLYNQGMILHLLRDSCWSKVTSDRVEDKEGKYFLLKRRRIETDCGQNVEVT